MIRRFAMTVNCNLQYQQRYNVTYMHFMKAMVYMQDKRVRAKTMSSVYNLFRKSFSRYTTNLAHQK